MLIYCPMFVLALKDNTTRPTKVRQAHIFRQTFISDDSNLQNNRIRIDIPTSEFFSEKEPVRMCRNLSFKVILNKMP